MKIYAYSKALYSTWFYLEPWRLLLDAGEGLNTFLEGRLLAFRDIALTHAHTDHFTGLQNIIVTRLREMEVTGQKLPTLSITYPADSETLKEYFIYLKKVTSRWDELVDLKPVMPGDIVKLQGVRGLQMRVLKADHFVYKQTALAYMIEQERWVLKPEVEGLPQTELNRRVAENGREAVTDRVMRPLMYYSGDGNPNPSHLLHDLPLVLHESTFLEEHTRSTHTSLPEVLELFREFRPQNMLLFHLSTRYDMKSFLYELDKQVEDEEMRSRIYAIRPGSMFVKDIPIPGF